MLNRAPEHVEKSKGQGYVAPISSICDNTGGLGKGYYNVHIWQHPHSCGKGSGLVVGLPGIPDLQHPSMDASTRVFEARQTPTKPEPSNQKSWEFDIFRFATSAQECCWCLHPNKHLWNLKVKLKAFFYFLDMIF